MTAVIPRDVQQQIVTDARTTDGSDRALDRLAAQHGLMLGELKAVLARAAQPPAAPPPQKPAATNVEPRTRACTQCGEKKPLTDFYRNPNGRHGRSSICPKCHNKRPATVSRLVRTRARNRAYSRLADLHRSEFERLLEAETVKAQVEHERLQAVASKSGAPDAKTARLKPGPKREGEQSVTDRLDVARCPSCHTHHDAAHQCPSCGDTTPVVAPEVKAFEVREWARARGLPVPNRGPIPAAVQQAYDAAHQKEKSA